MNTTKIYYVAGLSVFGAIDSLITDDLKKAIKYKNDLLAGKGFVKDPSDVSIVFECHNSYVIEGLEKYVFSDKMELNDNTVYKVSRYWGDNRVRHNNEPARRWTM